VTNTPFAVTGTATDNKQVVSVGVVLNDGTTNFATITASNKVSWSANVSPVPGSNQVYAVAVDRAGNTTNTLPVSFYYDVPSAFSLRVTPTTCWV